MHPGRGRLTGGDGNNNSNKHFAEKEIELE